MNKDLIKLALIGMTAGFCLSAKEAPSSSADKEIAMTKCSKEKPQTNGGSGSSCSGSKGSSCSGSKGSSCSGSSGSSCSGSDDEENDGSSCNCGPSQGDQSSSSQMKNKRKSAAQKVVQGQ